MNRKQIFAMSMAAAVACSAGMAAFAVDANKAENTTAAENTAAENTAAEQPAVQTSLRGMGTVQSVGENSVLIKDENDQEIQLNIGEQTVIVDNATGAAAALADVKAGDKVYAYYSAAMTRSLPPQSACEVLLVNVGESTPASLHTVGEVKTEEDGVSAIWTADGSMIIRVDDKTTYAPYRTRNIVGLSDLTEGTRFLAWYDIVAMSYPGQTFTQRIVILPAEETAETGVEPTAETRGTEETAAQELAIVADGKTLTEKAVKEGDVVMVPVRAVAEALGCEISYAREDGKEKITVSNETRTMTMTVGEDLYVSAATGDLVGMTAPTELGAAPRIEAPGTTWAPAELFRVLVGYDVAAADGTVTITTAQAAE